MHSLHLCLFGRWLLHNQICSFAKHCLVLQAIWILKHRDLKPLYFHPGCSHVDCIFLIRWLYPKEWAKNAVGIRFLEVGQGFEGLHLVGLFCIPHNNSLPFVHNFVLLLLLHWHTIANWKQLQLLFLEFLQSKNGIGMAGKAQKLLISRSVGHVCFHEQSIDLNLLHFFQYCLTIVGQPLASQLGRAELLRIFLGELPLLQKIQAHLHFQHITKQRSMMKLCTSVIHVDQKENLFTMLRMHVPAMLFMARNSCCKQISNTNSHKMRKKVLT